MGGTSTGAAIDDGITLGPRSPFEPVGVTPRYDPPRAWIHPDRERSWVARMQPIVVAHRGLLVAGVVASVAGMIVQVALPAVGRAAIDDALIARTDALEPYIWALLGLGVLRGILSFSSRFALFRMAYELEFDLRNILFEHLARLSFGFYDRVQSGQVISRANSDIRSVQLYLAFAPLMATSVLSFVLAVGFMLSIHVPLTLVAISTLPGVFFFGRALTNRVFPLSWITQGRVADIATIVDENIAGVRVVKGFAAERRQVDQLAAAARRLRWAAEQQIHTRSRFAPVVENLPRLGLALVLLYGGLLAIDGEVSVGTLFAFNAYVLQMQVPFRLLGFFLMLGERARSSADRIFELVDEPVTIADRPGAIDLVEPRGEVRFDDVTFRYTTDGPAVLEGFTLALHPGERIAIVGATGSGKSTVARLLARFYTVEAGTISVDGHRIEDLTLVSLRAALGIVLDEPFLFSESVRDNIAYARPQAGDHEVEAAARAAQADAFIAEMDDGYGTVVGERGYTLSGGQRQRIAIARTLLAAPRVLVLDDATSAIDVHVEELIHLALAEHLTDRTVIVIAHRLSTIALADRVVLLDGGRVAADGTHAQLLRTSPRYAEILATVIEDEPELPDEPDEPDEGAA
jgi:ATP-binding cassette subfamily B protein